MNSPKAYYALGLFIALSMCFVGDADEAATELAGDANFLDRTKIRGPIKERSDDQILVVAARRKAVFF